MMVKNTIAPVVSVVVCTYNRADLLTGCLTSLVDQMMDKSTFEVIVVNNNSTDETQAVAEAIAAAGSNIRVVFEKKPGASQARNRGVREAQGAYVAFIDDDARAESDWLEKLVEVIEAVAPDVCGGSIYPFYLSAKPPWFKDEYEIRRVRDTPGFLSANKYISASNLIFRKAFLEKIGGFDQQFGPKGDLFSYGEETELLARAREYSPDCKVYYDPAVRVLHLVPARKMRVGYFIKARWTVGLNHLDIFRLRHRGRIATILRLFYTVGSITVSLLVGIAARHRSKHPYWQNYVVEQVAPRFSALGHYLAELKR